MSRGQTCVNPWDGGHVAFKHILVGLFLGKQMPVLRRLKIGRCGLGKPAADEKETLRRRDGVLRMFPGPAGRNAGPVAVRSLCSRAHVCLFA